ncbi:unnamed protein product [Albugo candida]|uniref:Uncharacterized protein n=1 Tax=Albugo candida TaxID=65357 RepID=A0A024GJU2_9STRA|nr:unnamed protein product [Albugo candida]|eukprot:CCI46787.1 unnamed protein product [Albugo candida]
MAISPTDWTMQSQFFSDAVADLTRVANHLQESIFNKSEENHDFSLHTTAVGANQLISSRCEVIQQASKEDLPWIHTLSHKANANDIEERDSSDRILRRYRSLRSTIAKLREKSKKLAAEAESVNDNVEKKLEEQEIDWEKEMKVKGEQIERLKAILADETKSPCVSPSANSEKSHLDDEIQVLEEAINLRQRELRDLHAATKSVKTERECKRKRENLEALLSSSPRKQAHPDVRKLCAELKLMLARKKPHETKTGEVTRKKAKKSSGTESTDQCAELGAVRTELVARKRILANLISRLRSIVESNWDMEEVSSIKSCILNSLYLHSGQINMAELKEKATKAMDAKNRVCSSEEITRALYSLVAHDIIQIDRSQRDGLVTLLLL